MTIPRSKGQSNQNQCRLCGRKVRKGTLIFKDKSETTATSSAGSSESLQQQPPPPPLSELIFDCLRLKVTEEDLLPKLVCTDCEKKLGSWLNFFTKCKETQVSLRKSFNVTEAEVTITSTAEKASIPVSNEESRATSDWPEEKTAVEVPSTSQKSNKGKEESTVPTYKCPVCKKEFNKRTKFAEHLTSHVKPDEESPHRWPCPVCPKKLRSCEGLARHQETHLESRNYCCHVCGRLFQTLTCLLNHLRVQHGPESGPGARPSHVCPICGRTFRQSTHMVQHLRTHTGERPYWCRDCDSRFTTSGQLQRHVQAVHQCLKRFKCDLCGKEFLYSHNYKAHMQRHEGNKELRCDLCEKTFFTKNALFRHRRFHTGEKPFQCDICGKKFADCSNRKRHRQHHHKVSTEVSNVECTDTQSAAQNSEVVLLMQQPEENATDENGKTFTSLRTFLMEDFLHVQLVTYDENRRDDMALVSETDNSPHLLDVNNIDNDDELTLQPVGLNSSDLSLQHMDPCVGEDPQFNLDTISTDGVDITASLDAPSPVDLSQSLDPISRSPLHITPPSLRNSPTNMSPTMENNSLDLSPSLQPMGGSPLHLPSSDFLLTLNGY